MNNKRKKIVRKLVAAFLILAMGISFVPITRTEAYQKDWYVYYASFSAHVTSLSVVIPYQHNLTHNAKATSITGPASNKYAVLQGSTIKMYNISTARYNEKYTFSNTTTTAVFRPYPISGEPANSTFLISSHGDLGAAYYINGYVKY